MKKLALLTALFFVACSNVGLPEDDIPATGRSGGTMFPIKFPEPAPLKVTNGYNGIFAHGGPVLHGTINVYFIWYGNWSATDTAPAILTNLAKSIGGSPYFNINTTYFDSTGSVSNSVAFGGTTVSTYAYSASINDATVANIVSTALANNSLPTDTNGVYFVLTSAEINETSGFCSHYCGWHTKGTLNSKNIKYAFIGNGDHCPGSCEAQQFSPNSNPAADGMASVIAHELEESATDPNLDAWYDRRGAENADKCAWTWGTTYTATNGSNANMNFGGLDYLIQRNWVNANGGYCALSY